MKKRFRKHKTLFLNLFLTIFTTILVVIITSIALGQIQKKSKETSTNLIFDSINEAVNDLYLFPLTSVKNMGSSTLLKEFINEEEDTDEYAAKMSAYLTNIRNSNSLYTNAYFVSNKTYNYYTTIGKTKKIDPINNSYDVWYTEFLNSSNGYDLDINTDENNNDLWTLFIDYKIYNTNGDFLGICGIGILLSNIQEVLKNFKSSYRIEAFFQDKDGNIIIDANNIYMDNPTYNASTITPKNTDFSYTEGHDYIRGKFLDDFGWFLVVRNSLDPYNSIINIFIITIIILIILTILIFALTNLLFSHYDRKKLNEKIVIDSLSNVYNREGFVDLVNDKLDDKIGNHYLLMADLDNFKAVNDVFGHDKGDEVIIHSARVYKDILGDRGIVGRIGGDEFIMMVEANEDEIIEIAKKINQELDIDICSPTSTKMVHISTSIGIVPINEKNKKYADLYKKADIALYQSKDKGKNCYTINKE